MHYVGITAMCMLTHSQNNVVCWLCSFKWRAAASISTGFRDENAKGYMAGQDSRYWDIAFYTGVQSFESDPSFNRYRPNDKDTRGKAILDPNFSLYYPTDVQDHLEAFCDKFETLPCALDGETLKICVDVAGSGKKVVPLEGTTQCFIRNFYRWHGDNFGGRFGGAES